MRKQFMWVSLVAACTGPAEAETGAATSAAETSSSAGPVTSTDATVATHADTGSTVDPSGTPTTGASSDSTTGESATTDPSAATTTTTTTSATTGETTTTTDATTTTAGTTTTDETTTGSGDGVTWYRDVLPVAQARCMGCHRDGGIGSFTMEDVKVAQSYAGLMKSATATREMPPWMPDPACQSFHDARILGDDEIALFAAWADGGALAGDPADAPAPVPPPSLGKVDIVLEASAPYTPDDGLGDDDYRCLVLDPKHGAALSLVGVNFLPDQADMVHHVVLFAVDRQTALNKDAGTPGLGWTCFGGPGTPGAMNTLGAWVPGSPPLMYPQGTGLTLATSDVIVMQMHYNFENLGGAAPKPDQTRVQLQYAAGPVTTAKMIPIVDMGFTIPKNSMGYSHGAEMTFQQSTRLYGMLPHMHKLGRQISITSSALGCMIDIPDWDFHWQQFYFYENHQGMVLPAKSKLKLECTWDNPGAQPVGWGEGTADEMCVAFVYTTTP